MHNTVYHMHSTVYHMHSTVYHMHSTVYHMHSTVYHMHNTVYHMNNHVTCIILSNAAHAESATALWGGIVIATTVVIATPVVTYICNVEETNYK